MGRHIPQQMALDRRLPQAPSRGGRHSGSSPLSCYPGYRNNVPSPRARDYIFTITHAHLVIPFPSAIRMSLRFHQDSYRDAATAALRPLHLRPATAAWRHLATTRHDRILTAGVHRPNLSAVYEPSSHDSCFPHDRPAARYPTNPWAEDRTLLDFSLDEVEAADDAEASPAAKAVTAAAAAMLFCLPVRQSANRRQRLPVVFNRRNLRTFPTTFFYLFFPDMFWLHAAQSAPPQSADPPPLLGLSRSAAPNGPCLAVRPPYAMAELAPNAAATAAPPQFPIRPDTYLRRLPAAPDRRTPLLALPPALTALAPATSLRSPTHGTT